MSTTLLYAVIMSIGQIVLTLIGYFLGYQTDKMASGGWYGWIPFLYAVVINVLAIKAVREESPGKYLTYGKGVFTAFMIAVYSGLIGSIYAYIHFTFVNPNFTDYLIEASRVKWEAAGMAESAMANAEKGIRWFTKPGVQAVVGFILSICFGTIIGLVASAFLKRNPPEEGKVTA